MSAQLQLMLADAFQNFQAGHLTKAEEILSRCVHLHPNNFDALHFLAVLYASQGKHPGAIEFYKKALQYSPNNASALSNFGSSLNAMGRNREALSIFQKAINVDPSISEFWFNAGNALCDLAQYKEALSYYEQAVHLNPEYYQAHNNYGKALFDLKQYLDSLIHYEKALSINQHFFECLINKGVTLNELKRYDEAIANYDKALSLKPDYAECWSNKGVTLNELKRYDEAIAHYDKALSLKPDYAECWSNKGVTLNELKRYDEAIAHYDKALSLKPDYFEAYSNKGNVLNELKRYDEAMAHHDKALSLNPDYAEGWAYKALTLSELKRYLEAITSYEKALSLKANIDWVYGDFLHTKMKICSWSGFAESLEDISKKVVANERVVNPFPLLAVNDDASLHKQSSEIYVQVKYPFNATLGPILKRPKGQKIRVGYFSADFHNHATGYLMAELFELHDKSQFELIGFSFGPVASDGMRQRLENSFDQFIEVGDKSDIEIAQLSRNLNIDIAVDLKGFTQDSRTGIFAYRTAPIQVNYLGYPGTMGADYMDYIIADKTIVPVEAQACYSEKIAYLPYSYQVNDRKRLIADRQFTRQELGLPQNAFVFCCFNNNYKILPATFAMWMRILKTVEGSVLWLFQDNPWAADNLKKEAEKQGIRADRLVFAGRMTLHEHLARHGLADLFLDTFPCNAHTTASDALWAGLPVLTLKGQSFASRVAASLLNAIGLPELITNTQEAYEALAIELANNPQKLIDIKLKLAKNRLTAPLFDTPLFAKNLEAAYIKMMERYQLDLEPDHIAIN